MKKILTVLLAALAYSAQAQTSAADPLAATINLADRDFPINALPKPLAVREPLGLATFPWVQGQVLHQARRRPGVPQGVWANGATVTPSGDYLLMFPDGGHMAGNSAKINDLLAYRSKDRGKTWQGPTVAFDIDYNQLNFIPLIPKGSKRLYAFGTQPMAGTYSRENGQNENAPIGYRYSDDDGVHWSEVRLIRPKNDPDFLGISAMRMTETAKGTWLLGTHEGDWSYKPLITRQYVLRSEDQGKTWELLPGKRHGGWHVKGYGRMDEGRLLALPSGNVLLMLRSPEGHLWASRSTDDGKTWSDPAPTPLVHPDAPPMLFPLSDGKTLVAFHHNRSHTKSSALDGQDKKMMGDRSELWFSTSTDEGQTWSEPRLFLVNALAETFDSPFRNYNCSYLDAFADGGQLHCFLPHRWDREVYLHFDEKELAKFPTKKDLGLSN